MLDCPIEVRTFALSYWHSIVLRMNLGSVFYNPWRNFLPPLFGARKTSKTWLSIDDHYQRLQTFFLSQLTLRSMIRALRHCRWEKRTPSHRAGKKVRFARRSTELFSPVFVNKDSSLLLSLNSWTLQRSISSKTLGKMLVNYTNVSSERITPLDSVKSVITCVWRSTWFHRIIT